MAPRIAHICWLPNPQSQRNATIKRVQFLPTLYLLQGSELMVTFKA
jgi:hypothetical protein